MARNRREFLAQQRPQRSVTLSGGEGGVTVAPSMDNRNRRP
jgi:hypothetical protein